MTTRRPPWVLAGILAGCAGLATSYASAMALTIHEAPVVAAAKIVVDRTPRLVAARVIDFLGPFDGLVLRGGVVAFLLGCFALAGAAARTGWWRPVPVWIALGSLGLGAVALQSGTQLVDVIPVVVGLLTWITVHSALTDALFREQRRPDLQSHERRVFVMVAAAIGVASIGIAGAGRLIGAGRRHVEVSRQLLRIDAVTRREPPLETSLGLDGVSAWQTPDEDFFLFDTTIVQPTIEPAEWSLRIHGLVQSERTVTYADLVARELTESWITLGCVRNEVGGGLVGNARWSGVRIADLLNAVGVQDTADCVLQTSQDGWTCVTPLEALTDERDAMLAVAMNGRPLPIEHGFPVRTIVPGLYGYVSATKWVVDFEVTTFERAFGYWTDRGWSALGPVKPSSRIDVPRPGAEVVAGALAVGGVAWHQHTGITDVQVQLDGREWRSAELAQVPSVDTWVQWALTLEVPPGDHTVRVRAVSRDGTTQSGVMRDVLPDGATGLHAIEFRAR